MLNSATLAVILLFILSAILFTSTTVSIAIYYARKKADTEEKALCERRVYVLGCLTNIQILLYNHL